MMFETHCESPLYHYDKCIMRGMSAYIHLSNFDCKNAEHEKFLTKLKFQIVYIHIKEGYVLIDLYSDFILSSTCQINKKH